MLKASVVVGEQFLNFFLLESSTLRVMRLEWNQPIIVRGAYVLNTPLKIFRFFIFNFYLRGYSTVFDILDCTKRNTLLLKNTFKFLLCVKYFN